MYQASSQFQQMINNPSRKFSWSGQLFLRDGETIDFTDQDILKGSGYIHRSCSGSNELEIGSVYASECGISLLLPVDRYRLEGAMISLRFHLYYENGRQESVPMGNFDVIEANRSKKRIDIKGFDAMLRFDRLFNVRESFGTAFELLEFMCQRCRVQFGMSEKDVQALPNGEEVLSIYQGHDIESYRDLLHYVASVLGCVAQINRLGQLVLIHYGDQPVTRIEASHRFESNVSDFKTYYTAINSTNAKTKIAEYYALETDTGLTMNLGINPLMQLGLQSKRERMCQRLLEVIAKISYTPFEAVTIGNPCLDPGDRIEQVVEGEVLQGLITSIEYKINGKHRIICVGKNPYFAQAKSKHDKNLIGILNQIQSEHTVVHTYTNSQVFDLSTEDIPVIQFEFASDKETQALFNASVLLEVETETMEVEQSLTLTPEASTSTEEVVRPPLNYRWLQQTEKPTQVIVSYVLNDERIEYHVPIETYLKGQHVLNLFFPLDRLQEKTMNSFTVLMRLDSGRVHIDKDHVIASISGQSLGTTEVWDGKITVSDFWEKVPLIGGTVFTGRLKEESLVQLSQPLDSQLQAHIQRVVPQSIALSGWKDDISMEVNDV